MRLLNIISTSCIYLSILLIILYEPTSIIAISFLLILIAIIKPEYFVNILIFLGFIFSLNEDIFLIESLVPLKQLFVFSLSLFYIIVTQELRLYNKISNYILQVLFFFIVHSIFFSKFPVVSIFKIVNFSLTLIVILELSMRYTFSNLIDIYSVHFKCILLLTLIFVAIYPESVFHFMGDETRIDSFGLLFKGIFNHSNPFGQYLSISIIFLMITYKNQENKINQMFFIFLGIIFLILTQSRTSFISFLSALFLFLIFTQNFNIKIIAFIFFAFLFFQQSDTLLLIKDDTDISKSFSEIYFDARPQLLIIYRNILDNLPIGIGFGIPSVVDSFTQVTEIPFLKIPLSMSSEKGNIFFALLEELGVFSIILFYMLTLLIKHLAANKNIFLILLITIVFTNFGEYNFFSIGGNGFNILLYSIFFVKDDFD